MYEHKREPLLTAAQFRLRVARHVAVAGVVIGAALGLGVAGYHVFEAQSWLDALLNASMILGGMGPVDRLNTDGGKLFASFYALFSGLLFSGVTGILLAPLAHRFMHRLHADRL